MKAQSRFGLLAVVVAMLVWNLTNDVTIIRSVAAFAVGVNVCYAVGWLAEWWRQRDLEDYGRAVHQPWGAGAVFRGWRPDIDKRTSTIVKHEDDGGPDLHHLP